MTGALAIGGWIMGAVSFGGITATAIAGSTFLSVVAGAIGGAVIGAAVGGLSAAVMGGDIMDGVLFGAIGGAVMGGVGGYFQAAGTAAKAAEMGLSTSEYIATGGAELEGMMTGATGEELFAFGETGTKGSVGILKGGIEIGKEGMWQAGASLAGDVMKGFATGEAMEEQARLAEESAAEQLELSYAQLAQQKELAMAQMEAAGDPMALLERRIEGELALSTQEAEARVGLSAQEAQQRVGEYAAQIEEQEAVAAGARGRAAGGLTGILDVEEGGFVEAPGIDVQVTQDPTVLAGTVEKGRGVLSAA